jgi:hypothetical protein
MFDNKDDETSQISLLNADSLAKISFVKNFYLVKYPNTGYSILQNYGL